MKLFVLAIASGTFALWSNAASAQATSEDTHKIGTPDEIAWSAGPASLPAGAQGALLYGDPAKEGPFLLRLKMPAGYKIPPHNHPRPEIVTVISGAFHVGMGEAADAAKTRRLPTGSYFAFDPGMNHYAHVEEETVVQLSSVGPWSINYVNKADDPRAK